jgi:hypothetical protein
MAAGCCWSSAWALFGRWLRRRDDRAVALSEAGGHAAPLAVILPFYLIILLR